MELKHVKLTDLATHQKKYVEVGQTLTKKQIRKNKIADLKIQMFYWTHSTLQV